MRKSQQQSQNVAASKTFFSLHAYSKSSENIEQEITTCDSRFFLSFYLSLSLSNVSRFSRFEINEH